MLKRTISSFLYNTKKESNSSQINDADDEINIPLLTINPSYGSMSKIPSKSIKLGTLFPFPQSFSLKNSIEEKEELSLPTLAK